MTPRAPLSPPRGSIQASRLQFSQQLSLDKFLRLPPVFRTTEKLDSLLCVAYSGAVNHRGPRAMVTALLLLSVTAGLSQEKPDNFAWEKARGTIVDPMVCLDDPAQSYALYLPSAYSPDRRWPVIYAFDAGGRGRTAVEVYQSAAEKYGYIVAASNNSKNGPASIQTEASQAVWLDTHRRFSIDKNRVYTTGFSGGARAATSFALYCYTCAVAGVIAQGAGYPVMDRKTPPINDHFAYYVAIGDVDFNFPEIMTLRRKKDEQGMSFKIKVYPGQHQWAPPAIAEDAIEWMEIKAMQSGVEKVNAVFVRRIFERTQAEAAQAERVGDALGQYYALRSLVRDFNGLEDITQFEAMLAALKVSKTWKDANRDEQREIALQASLTATASLELGRLGSVEAANQPMLAQHIASMMKNLQYGEKSNGSDRAVSSRAFAQLWMEGIEAGQDQFRQRRFKEAISYFALMAEVAPDQPGPLVLLAEANVRLGNKKEALKNLKEAVKRGLKYTKTLTEDPELRPLASDPTFQQIVQGTN
jgi:dienelactone hydrolase